MAEWRLKLIAVVRRIVRKLGKSAVCGLKHCSTHLVNLPTILCSSCHFVSVVFTHIVNVTWELFYLSGASTAKVFVLYTESLSRVGHILVMVHHDGAFLMM